MAKAENFINNDEELALTLGHLLHFLWGVTIHYRQLLNTFNLTKQSVTGVLIFIPDDDRYPWIRMNIYNFLGAEPGRDFNQLPPFCTIDSPRGREVRHIQAFSCCLAGFVQASAFKIGQQF